VPKNVVLHMKSFTRMTSQYLLEETFHLNIITLRKRKILLKIYSQLKGNKIFVWKPYVENSFEVSFKILDEMK
jgi:hypothetical protein